MTAALTSESLLAGTTVLRPPGDAEGYWVGAPSVYADPALGLYYLTYRVRRPRGDGALARGGEARIAQSRDGVHFDDVWSVTKADYGTTSIEKSALSRDPAGRWHYFTSFVKPDDRRWCVGRYSADRLGDLEPDSADVLFDASEMGLEGVKDPWIHFDGELYRMYLSVAVATSGTREESHATHDIYNTGDCVSATALATSRDLIDWAWHGVVLMPEAGWDAYCRRLNGLVDLGGRYLGFYDGIASHHANYEEKTGIAVSEDLVAWQVRSTGGPAFESAFASGSLRYMCACPDVASAAGAGGSGSHGSHLLYYEMAVPNGSHELRVARVPEGALEELVESLPARSSQG